MIEKTGIASLEQVKQEFPDKVVLKKPKAIIECYKEIPCNPCHTSCPFEAIYIPEDINVRPKIDFDKCTGCGICVYNCPGLAIMVTQIKDGKIAMRIPYEFTPLPEVNQTVYVVNRAGERISEAKVTRVQISEKQNKTALIAIELDEQYLYEAITIEVHHGS